MNDIAVARKFRRSMTVLELLLAMTIFSLISVAIFAVFSAGTRAYKATHRDAALLQRARYVMDTFETDVTALFYRDEDQYNTQSRARIEEYERDRLLAERIQDWTQFERKYNCPEDDKACRNDPNYVGNPFEKGKLIDLQMVGEDGGDLDRITFALKRSFEVGSPYYLWGVARVNYSVERGHLIRSMETVETNPRTWDGEILAKKTPPDHSIVASGVAYFDLSYAFWWDSQWLEVEAWSSGNRQLRNSQYLLGEYKDEQQRDESAQQASSVPPRGTEEYNQYVSDRGTVPYDRVPTYVRMRLGITDPERPGRIFEVARIFRIPNSQETWTINQSLTEDEREMEREVRTSQNSYVPVFPGALRKRMR